jgi:hypothetical protein
VRSLGKAPVVKRGGARQGGCGGGSPVQPDVDERAELKMGGDVPW